MALILALLSTALLLFFFTSSTANALSLNHYDKTCPEVESIVAKTVEKATKKDKTIPATLLRMHFHDCFIRSGGPTWNVPKGRKDGRISKATETIKLLPSPAFNISQLKQSFSLRGLSTDDIVALLGGHTLGFAHCSSFQNRIRKFNATHDIDPTMHPSFAASLRNVCPINNKNKYAGVKMDPSSTTFDNTHYKLILQGKTLFASDQALLSNPKAKNLVYKFASSKQSFYKAFVNSMIKMSSLNGGQEIRKDCRVVN
ncbi:Plant peroxidase [Corchorus capsularis]|uniref:peroxidase n=1 Tax=Corchorus capsularis TaxID=210143 RepID=A0A1R3JWD5_COCAP|nr:Plant peroxidase [Corchorus capsularis]